MRSALSQSTSRSASARSSIPSMPSVPLMRASPSFSCSSMGSMPASASSSGTGRSTPSRSVARPSPMSTRAQCESGARSPLQPRLPYSCTTGVMPALSSAAIVWAVTGRAPVRPEQSVLSLSSMSARTTSRSTSGPQPAACDRMSERCSWVRLSCGMCLVASAPKPVEMPYTGSACAASASTMVRVRSIAASASGERMTSASRRATATTSSAVMPWVWISTLSLLMRSPCESGRRPTRDR